MLMKRRVFYIWYNPMLISYIRDNEYKLFGCALKIRRKLFRIRTRLLPKY